MKSKNLRLEKKHSSLITFYKNEATNLASFLLSELVKTRDQDDETDGWKRARRSISKNSRMSKKLEGRSAPINRNIRFAAISSKPATTKLQYNTRSFYSAPSANNEPRRTITRRDFAQIERVINSRGQSRCLAPSPSAGSSSAESTPSGRGYFNPAATERLLIRRSADRREKGERAKSSRGVAERKARKK